MSPDAAPTEPVPAAARQLLGLGGAGGQVSPGPKPIATRSPRRSGEGSDSVDLPPRQLSLTDFLDLETLQAVQDGFVSITRLQAQILDAAGRPVTRPTDAKVRSAADAATGLLLEEDGGGELAAGGRFVAPIAVGPERLGSIVIDAPRHASDAGIGHDELERLAASLGLGPEERQTLFEAAEPAFAANRGASVQFLFLIANAITRLCYQAWEGQTHVQELEALYRVSTALAAASDVQVVLDTAAKSIAEVLDADGVVIRLLQEGPDGPELVRRANHGLSASYINSGQLLVNKSELYSKVIRGEIIYIEDLPGDARTYYPELAREEGLASMLALGLADHDQPIGSIQVYTVETRRFSRDLVRLARAVSQLVSAAISKTRLEQDRNRNSAMVRQMQLAAGVQRRMLPQRLPELAGFDVAARYIPSFQLSGDFYDFVRLGDGNVGFAIGDVAGKGIAASLLMASVRASLRAYAHDLYHLDEVIRRVNLALCRDTLDGEFATLWYGVLDPTARRLTYCNAGHEPPILVRDGHIIPLDAGGMIVGVDRDQDYDKGVVDLQPRDLLLLYTDGLPDAMNAEQKRFGRVAMEAMLREIANREGPPRPAAEGLREIETHLRNHAGARRGSDDTTLVLLRCT
ncbi:SpoIIE family protein phosphatase [Phycisphaera mikurensis]|uniref:Putative phosphatase n=1 Tax=Phycisphaera mikurensis (strain NBRC 102666 / KCTC 22515 / FYK2301M01) TaxID=1142394 RepID=I0II05_PHYMF|nr:SpoIIE family protein phosphatase [Phycisphaera mikurensis]MBB6442543.1 sigma-B regulation protein RsbU (phosphoserine phosphatase) [Phycisphaera mikurensis]BAM04893.1 putative phosphatase [Phycisphaera mikurensis NBRC 102666]